MITEKLSRPGAGPDFVQSIAAALDSGEQQITDLKQEQRSNYDTLSKEVSSPAATALLWGQCSVLPAHQAKVHYNIWNSNFMLVAQQAKANVIASGGPSMTQQ